MATIGLKLADGKFYPLFEENIVQKKKLVLTPAQNEQKLVKIAFYRNESSTTNTISHIGTLPVGNAVSAPETKPSIDLIIASDGKGKISAVARNTETGEQGRLSVTLEPIEKPSAEGRRIFEDSGQAPLNFLYEKKKEKKVPLLIIGFITAVFFIAGALFWFFTLRNKEGKADSATLEKAAQEKPDERGTSVSSPPAVPLEKPAMEESKPPVAEKLPDEAPLVKEPVPLTDKKEEKLVAEDATVAADLEESREKAEKIPAPSAVPLEKPAMEENKPPVAEKLPDETPLVKEPVPLEKEEGKLLAEDAAVAADLEESREKIEKIPAPVRSYNVPDPFPDEGLFYLVRWGDTLWDIADVFYKNPRLYQQIAEYNQLNAPDVLIAGTIIHIPRL